MYANDTYERITQNNSNMLVLALEYRKGLEHELRREGLPEAVRQRFEAELEIANYKVKVGMEFRRAQKAYERAAQEQPVVSPAPQAAQPQTIEARLVA